ncbi:hypothetical protein EON82_23100 [bacterium]|nr:MAG: hypothetical protein EON82_23100 [bacterium]
MRKRKSPIALVTVLAVMAAVAFGFQYATNRGPEAQSAPPPAQGPDDVKPVGESRPGTTASAVSDAVKSSMGTPAAKPMARPGPPGMPGAPGGGPTILSTMPTNAKPEKPKPNSSSTSTQWYNDESAYGKSGE